jgi:phosphohistidine phosphatase
LCSGIIHDEVKRTDDEVDVLFLFAHNPGITEYVNEITDAGIENVPTTGVVGIGYESKRWSTIS